jgi:hypothetical protein
MEYVPEVWSGWTMLNSEYGLWRELIVFMQYPIAFGISQYLRRITIIKVSAA